MLKKVSLFSAIVLQKLFSVATEELSFIYFKFLQKLHFSHFFHDMPKLPFEGALEEVSIKLEEKNLAMEKSGIFFLSMENKT